MTQPAKTPTESIAISEKTVVRTNLGILIAIVSGLLVGGSYISSMSGNLERLVKGQIDLKEAVDRNTSQMIRIDKSLAVQETLVPAIDRRLSALEMVVQSLDRRIGVVETRQEKDK